MSFGSFIEARMEVFGGLRPPYGMLYTDLFPSLRNCLAELAGIKITDVEQSELAWIQNRPAAARVRDVVRECAELEECPTIAVVRAVWARLTPPPPGHSTRCEECNGTGWVVKESGSGASYRSGAALCPQRIGPGVARTWKRLMSAVWRRRA